MATSMDSSASNRSGSSELFTDLDPLGTGKSRPYYDRKDILSDFKTQTSTPRSDSGSGPSSLTSQPSGPAPIAPAFSSMSSSGNPATMSNSSEFGRSLSNESGPSSLTKQLPNVVASGISAPPQVYLNFDTTVKKFFYKS
jgi:hypothetical protein